MSKPGSLAQQLYGWSLSSVLIELCDRAGISFDLVNIDKIEGSIDGFSTTSSQTVSAAIEVLQSIYMFDIANYDGQIHFPPRGEPIVATIELDDMVDAGDSIIDLTRDDSINTPKVMYLRYLDTDGGLTADMQKSDRSLDDRGTAESNLETTVIMRADDAARAITIIHKVKAEDQLGVLKFELPLKWLYLTVADPIMIGAERFRIDRIGMDEISQKYECIRDRASAYESSIAGVPAGIPSPPPNLTPADTIFQFIDSPMLDSTDDSLGFYVAVSSDTSDWKGAVIEMSRDGGENWVGSDISRANITMGQLTSGISAHSVYYPDRINTFTVKLLREDMTLTPATFAEMLSRTNLILIGDEIMNFSEVIDIGDDGEWQLGGELLRGRKGTAAVQHFAGERFILLPSNILDYQPTELFDLGKVLTFRTTSVGGTDSTEISSVFAGKSMIERQPAYLKARKVGSDIVATWRGIGKLGGGQNIGMSTYFTGYQVKLSGITYMTTAMTLTIPYSAGTLTVSQVNSITGPGPVASVTV